MTFLSLTQRVELEQGKRAPADVRELNLDHCKSTSLDGFSAEFCNLEILSMVGVGLETLAGMPKLPKLRILELTNNSIAGGLEEIVNCPNLQTLNLSHNKIKSVEALTPLSKLSDLKSLDLLNCEIAKSENYRKIIFTTIPNLKYLDGMDENNVPEPDVVGLSNGDEKANGTGDSEDDDDDDNDSDDDEEYGIEALQRSEDLEDDDEEDYAPGEEEEADLDEYDDLDDEEEEGDEIDDGANLSGAGVTGPRRLSSKRRHADSDKCDESEPVSKQKTGEDVVNNGPSENQ